MPEPKDILELNTFGKECLRQEYQHIKELLSCVSKYAIELNDVMTQMHLLKPSWMELSNILNLQEELWTTAELASSVLQSYTENLKKMQSMSISEESKELICC